MYMMITVPIENEKWAYSQVLLLLSYLTVLKKTSLVSGMPGGCDLYLATSSIPNAGMGVYSGIDVSKGSLVSNPDVCIPLADLGEGERYLISKYVWYGQNVGISSEFDAFCQGIFALGNSHQGLNNIDFSSNVEIDSLDIDQTYNSPGAGAFTPYFSAQGVATRPITAGSELFLDYGDHWFEYEGRKDMIENLPSSADYLKADELIRNFENFYLNHQDSLSADTVQLFWNFIIKTQEKSHPKVAKLLPESIHDIQRVAAIGTLQHKVSKNLTRPLDWLEEHGLCIGNLKAGISTIPHAGRGAFSPYLFKKGDTITSSPLIHECDPNLFDATIPPEYAYDGNKHRKQLFLNYCFSHPTSNLKLCPYSPHVSLINHSSKSPNVRIQWSTSEFHHQNWLSMSFNELCSQQYAGLVIDYIALRDIEVGEEILMDYGHEWEEAWQKHLENWPSSFETRTQARKGFMNVSELNEYELVVKTIQEQKEINSFYGDNIITECQFHDDRDDGDDEDSEDEDDYDSNDIVMKNLFDNIKDYLFQKNGKVKQILEHNGNGENSKLYECELYNRTNNKYGDGMDYYVAGIHLLESPGREEEEESIIYDIPRSAIRFNIDPFTNDFYYLSEAFRHPIVFPNDIFPKSWTEK